MTLLSVPVALAQAFSGPDLILRTAEPAAVPALLGAVPPERVAFLQVTDPTADLAPLADWGPGLPIDLVLRDPAADLPWLYRAAPLLDGHPVRVTVPLLPGLARAVRLALSLGLPVRLAGHQPDPAVLAEVREALALYLHNPTVEQPVEPFQGLMLDLLQGPGESGPVRLWSLLERDPDEVLVLDAAGVPLPDQAPAAVTAWRDGLLAQGAECRRCPWLPRCEGYFKWPHADYDCTGVRGLLGELRQAADELRAGLAEYGARAG